MTILSKTKGFFFPMSSIDNTIVFVKNKLKEMVIKHPDDEINKVLIEMIKDVDYKIKYLVKKYKMIYGDRPNLRKIQNGLV